MRRRRIQFILTDQLRIKLDTITFFSLRLFIEGILSDVSPRL